MHGDFKSFFGRFGRGWKGQLAVIAHNFHWPPSELFKLKSKDIKFWLEAIQQLNKP